MNLNNKRAYLIAFIGILVLFSCIQWKGLFVESDGDENVYFYMGKMLAQGELPYRDFFVAHPPLQLMVYAALYQIFGFKLFVFKLVPLLSIIISSIFLFLVVKHKWSSMHGLLAVILFLFSFVILFHSINGFGSDLALVFLSFGYYLVEVRKKYMWSGIVFALASLTRFYALIPIAIILAYYFLSERKNAWRLLIGFFGLFCLSQLVLLFVFGYPYFNDTILYHLEKTAAANRIEIWLEVLKLNVPILLSGLLGILFYRNHQLRLPLLIIGSYGIFLILQKRIFPHYFMQLFFFLAIVGSFSIVALFKKFDKKLAIAAAAVIIGIFLWSTAADVLFLQKVKFDEFNVPSQMQAFLENYPNQPFVGDALAPLVALKMDREIAQNLVDLNEQLFTTKILPAQEFSRKIANKEFPIIILSNSGIGLRPEVSEKITKHCVLKGQFKDGGVNVWGNYGIFECK